MAASKSSFKEKSIATNMTNVSQVLYTCPISALLAPKIEVPTITTSFDQR